MKACRKCGGMFNYNDGEEWKRDCLPCWIKEKNGEKKAPNESKFSGGHLHEEKLQEQVRQLTSRVRKLQDENATLRFQVHYGKPSGQFDADTLKRIRMLVHPDKHGNSAMSNEITQLINKLIN